MDKQRILHMASFMKARHDIYLARKAGKPGPWTTDFVLRDYRFCNIFRELDTVTIWIRENIREPYADHENLWMMLAIARYINWPPTLQMLMEKEETWPFNEKFSPAMLGKALENRAESKQKVYTGAYLIRPESDRSKPYFYWSKHRYIAEIVFGRLWEHRISWEQSLSWTERNENSLQQVWGWLCGPVNYVGWGPFMAYEVVTDMRHTRYLQNAPDIYSWANAGPGAIRGLNRLNGVPLNRHPNAETCTHQMRLVMLELNKLTEKELPGFEKTFGPVNARTPRFEMRDIEHSLCEYDKYVRVWEGEGKMRCKYDWKKAKEI